MNINVEMEQSCNTNCIMYNETTLEMAKKNLESVPLTENERKNRLQNIIDYIEVWRRQQIYLYLINRCGIQI